MADCEDLQIPVVDADYCGEINFSEISKLRFTVDGTPLADNLKATWDGRLDNADLADNTKIRTLHIVGSKPKPESNKITYSLGRSTNTPKKHTVPFKVDETGDNNYALIRWLEENPGIQIRCWWEIGKHIYGGLTGVLCNLTLDHIVDESDEVLQVFEGELYFEGLTPVRDANPLI